MTHIHTLVKSVITTVSGLSFVQRVSAQVFDGPGLIGGLDAISGTAGLPDGDVRTVVIRVLNTVLSFLALIAVIAVIIAGIYLIVGMGSDESKEKAKKIIFYTLIGLTIVLFARVIVGIVTVFLANAI